jgi:hypothetical protein
MSDQTTVDDIGFDGVTVREAIASRTFLGIQQLMEDIQVGTLTFDAAYRAISVLLEVTLPFCDPGSKGAIAELQKALEQERRQRASAQP